MPRSTAQGCGRCGRPTSTSWGDVSEGICAVSPASRAFSRAVGVILPKATMTTATPTTVLCFGAIAATSRSASLYNGKVSGTRSPGTPARRGHQLITSPRDARRGRRGRSGLASSITSSCTLMVSNTVRGLPVWFNEGLAEYYRTLQIASRRASSARRPHSRATRVVAAREFLPVDQLVAVDHRSRSTTRARKPRSSTRVVGAGALHPVGAEPEVRPEISQLSARSWMHAVFKACQRGWASLSRKLQRSCGPMSRASHFR